MRSKIPSFTLLVAPLYCLKTSFLCGNNFTFFERHQCMCLPFPRHISIWRR
uniref:Uncharacterized protein n=1 Tax=Anguilla anguilla TaxID=7936 RepID=A0A0E9SHM0_ANGAN